MFLWQAIRGIAPVEVVVFKNTNNFVQFDVIKIRLNSKSSAILLNSISAEETSPMGTFFFRRQEPRHRNGLSQLLLDRFDRTWYRVDWLTAVLSV